MPSTKILVFAYARPEETDACLNALAWSLDQRAIDVVVICDGSPEINNPILNNNIQNVREVVRSHSVKNGWEFHYRERNYGLSASVVEGINKAFETHDSVIVIEDDLVIERTFIPFMLEALKRYREVPHVYGIAGNSFYNKDPEGIFPDTYLLPIVSSWGWATWKEKWAIFSDDAVKLLDKIKKHPTHLEFDFGSYPYTSLLMKKLINKVDSWAIVFYASMFLNSGYFVYPKYSLCHNLGNKTGATHTKSSHPFFPRILKKDFLPQLWNIDVSHEVVARMQNHFLSTISR